MNRRLQGRRIPADDVEKLLADEKAVGDRKQALIADLLKQKEAAIARFVRNMPGERLQVAEGEASLCGVYVETHEQSGLAWRVAPLRLGGRLAPHWPLGVRGMTTVP